MGESMKTKYSKGRTVHLAVPLSLLRREKIVVAEQVVGAGELGMSKGSHWP